MTRERLVVQRPGNFRCAPVRGVTDGGQPPVSVVFAAGRRGVSDSLDVLAAVGRCRGGVIFLFIPGKAGACLRGGRQPCTRRQRSCGPSPGIARVVRLRPGRRGRRPCPAGAVCPACLLPSEHFQFETLALQSLRPVVLWKKRCFSALFWSGGAVPRLAFYLFQR